MRSSLAAGMSGHAGSGELPRRVVLALGGNALIRRGERGEFAQQWTNVELAADAIFKLSRLVSEVVVTHGNGPQVGFLALQAEAGMPAVPAPTFDILGAETQGQIGYMLSQALRNRLQAASMERDIAVVLTQVTVDPADPAFVHPTKPVGPVYSAEEAVRLRTERGWSVAPDHQYWRRVVPSPRPRRIVEAAPIRRLVDQGTIVIASGGGGIPVVEQSDHRLRGIEAVIDKDLAAVLLAATVGADGLILLTDVDGVYHDWGGPSSRRLPSLTPVEAEALLAGGTLPAGSMGPKVAACAQFVRAGGKLAAIGALDDIEGILTGRAGTRVTEGTAPNFAGSREARTWEERPRTAVLSERGAAD